MTAIIEEKDLLALAKKSYLKMLVCSLFVVLLGVAAAHLCNQLYQVKQIWVTVLEYIGYICWGTTLGAVGPKLLGWNYGGSCVENFDQRISMWLSWIGIFVFVMAHEISVIIYPV